MVIHAVSSVTENFVQDTPSYYSELHFQLDVVIKLEQYRRAFQIISNCEALEEEERERLVRAYRDEGAVISTQSAGKDHVTLATSLMGGPENTRD